MSSQALIQQLLMKQTTKQITKILTGEENLKLLALKERNLRLGTMMRMVSIMKTSNVN